VNAVKLLSASPCAAVCRNMPESIDDDMMARCTEELFESHSETAQESWTQIHGNIPTEVITGALGVVGLALCFLGWMLVRPANLTAGCYLGGWLAIVALNNFAPGEHECLFVVPVVFAGGLLTGLFCAFYRKSMYGVLGLLSGGIVGRYVYFAIVERATSSLGVNSMWMCMGFFGAFFMLVCLYVGDFSWMIATALLGAYLAMTSLAEVVLIPYAPNGEEYRAFLTLTRDAVHRRDTEGIFQGLVADSPYLLGPLAGMVGLAFAGVLVQLFLFNKAAATKTRPKDPEADTARLIAA
jgi:hypothetical protein